MHMGAHANGRPGPSSCSPCSTAYTPSSRAQSSEAPSSGSRLRCCCFRSAQAIPTPLEFQLAFQCNPPASSLLKQDDSLRPPQPPLD
jgi:hypothetical protein